MSYRSESTAPRCQRPRLDLSSDKSGQSTNDQNLWSQKSSLSPNLQPPSPPVLAPGLSSSVNLPLSFGDKYILVEQFETSNLFRCVDTQTTEEFCCKVCPLILCFIFIALISYSLNRWSPLKIIISSSPVTCGWTVTHPSTEWNRS